MAKENNPLRSYLDNLVAFDELDILKKYKYIQNRRREEFDILDRYVLDKLKPFEFTNIMFEVNNAHRLDNMERLNRWKDDINTKVKRGYVPKKEITNYKRYIMGVYRKYIKGLFYRAGQNLNIEVNKNNMFDTQFRVEHKEEVNEIMRKVLKELILFYNTK